jgi:hypothetical protein
MDEAILEQATKQANHAIDREAKRGAAVRRLLQLQDEQATEPVARAKYDLDVFWCDKIKQAMDKNIRSVDNFPWFWFARADVEYVVALRELLGPLFQVIRRKGLFGDQYVEVSW